MATPPTGNPEGRPSLYRPEYCDLVKEDMAKGYSLGAFAGLVGVNRSTLNNWMTDHPEFLEAVKEGKAKRLRQGETAMLLGATTKGGVGNPTLIMFWLQNMGWREEVNMRHSGSIGQYDLAKLPVEELERLRNVLASVAAEPGRIGPPDRDEESASGD